MTDLQPSETLAESCAYLLAIPAFGDFLDEVRRMRELVVRDLMTNEVGDYEEFVGYRAEYRALNKVLEMAEFEAQNAIDQGEDNE